MAWSCCLLLLLSFQADSVAPESNESAAIRGTEGPALRESSKGWSDTLGKLPPVRFLSFSRTFSTTGFFMSYAVLLPESEPLTNENYISAVVHMFVTALVRLRDCYTRPETMIIYIRGYRLLPHSYVEGTAICDLRL